MRLQTSRPSYILYSEDIRLIRVKPKLIIAGYSAFPRLLDYPKFRAIASRHNALLLADIAHLAGLIAAQVIPSPFPSCDVVTTTTHKSLRGPRGALIFSRKALSDKVDSSVFPGCQGGPHNHSISAIAAALKMAQGDEFRDYQNQILTNAKTLARVLQKHGCKLVTGGTDNHMVLVDLLDNEVGRIQSCQVINHQIDGNTAEKALEAVNIVTNKNSVLRDTSVRMPHGLRLGG